MRVRRGFLELTRIFQKYPRSQSDIPIELVLTGWIFRLQSQGPWFRLSLRCLCLRTDKILHASQSDLEKKQPLLCGPAHLDLCFHIWYSRHGRKENYWKFTFECRVSHWKHNKGINVIFSELSFHHGCCHPCSMELWGPFADHIPQDDWKNEPEW